MEIVKLWSNRIQMNIIVMLAYLTNSVNCFTNMLLIFTQRMPPWSVLQYLSHTITGQPHGSMDMPLAAYPGCWLTMTHPQLATFFGSAVQKHYTSAKPLKFPRLVAKEKGWVSGLVLPSNHVIWNCLAVSCGWDKRRKQSSLIFYFLKIICFF